jgi:hypothetical protein
MLSTRNATKRAEFSYQTGQSFTTNRAAFSYETGVRDAFREKIAPIHYQTGGRSQDRTYAEF